MVCGVSNKKFYEQMIVAPQKIIQEFDLIYINEDNLPITRSRNADDFSYKINGKEVKQKSLLKRISALAIPPGWKQVRITNLSNGHLQAVGYDNKNRKQYRYHPKWILIRNQTKFFKIAAFGDQLPIIRKQIEKDLEQKSWCKNKVIALVIRLMEETHIRIGNEKYAKQNKSYGLSTLRKKHVDIDKNLLRLEFVGKKGIKHSISIKNKKLIRLVTNCQEIPGWEVFKYYDENGQKRILNSTDVNTYLHLISGENFSAKDFRTWSASLIFFEALKEYGIQTDIKQIQQNIIMAYDQTATALGNTRKVCKNYYVHPSLISEYENGTLGNYFKKAEEDQNINPYLSPSEVSALELFKKFRPDLPPL